MDSLANAAQTTFARNAVHKQKIPEGSLPSPMILVGDLCLPNCAFLFLGKDSFSRMISKPKKEMAPQVGLESA